MGRRLEASVGNSEELRKISRQDMSVPVGEVVHVGDCRAVSVMEVTFGAAVTRTRMADKGFESKIYSLSWL